MGLAFYQLVGILFLILGLLLLVTPFLLRVIPSLENIPWVILYIYKRDGFIFVTSPILIVLSIISLLLNFITKRT